MLAVGGHGDRYGFQDFLSSVPDSPLLAPAIGSLAPAGIGATWIFNYNGTSFNQLGEKLVGSGSMGQYPAQGKILLTFDASHFAFKLDLCRLLPQLLICGSFSKVQYTDIYIS